MNVHHLKKSGVERVYSVGYLYSNVVENAKSFIIQLEFTNAKFQKIIF